MPGGVDLLRGVSSKQSIMAAQGKKMIAIQSKLTTCILLSQTLSSLSPLEQVLPYKL